MKIQYLYMCIKLLHLLPYIFHICMVNCSACKKNSRDDVIPKAQYKIHTSLNFAKQ